ncbi:hypothetical protein ACFLQI_01400 [Candidatus Undinarchaeota archaeon]
MKRTPLLLFLILLLVPPVHAERAQESPIVTTFTTILEPISKVVNSTFDKIAGMLNVDEAKKSFEGGWGE